MPPLPQYVGGNVGLLRQPVPILPTTVGRSFLQWVGPGVFGLLVVVVVLVEIVVGGRTVF